MVLAPAGRPRKLGITLAYQTLMEQLTHLVRGIIAEGCEKAREVAGQTIDDVKQAMGLAYR